MFATEAVTGGPAARFSARRDGERGSRAPIAGGGEGMEGETWHLWTSARILMSTVRKKAPGEGDPLLGK